METSVDIAHDKCRQKVCLVCYKKAKRGISKAEEEFINYIFIEGYSVEHENFPSGLCGGCELLLRKRMTNDKIALPWTENLDPKRPTNLRSLNECTCRICKVAKSSGYAILLQKRKSKRGRPKFSEEGPPSIDTKHFKLCATCYGKIYIGCRHPCSDGREARVKNIEKLALSPGTKEALAARTINNTKEKKLTTLGPRKKSLEQPPSKKSLFSSESMNKIQINHNLSTRGLKGLAQDMRKESGSRRIIESGLLEKNHIKNHQLDDYFEIRNLSFHQTDKETKVVETIERPTVVCKDLSGFIDFIIEARNLDPKSVALRIGLDGGGGFIKVCLSVFDPEMNMRGTCMSKLFKDTGVKKAFILALVPDTPENQHNVKRLWINSSIDTLNRKFTIATDLKMINILLGIQSHSCSHPCSWCNISKQHLMRKGDQRTLGTLKELFWSYYDSKADKSKAKDFGNVVHPCMIKNVDESTPVLLVVPPPELHLMMGTVNHLYNSMVKEWPGATAWLDACYVKKGDYHGGAFEGNDCRKLLKKVTVLREICPRSAEKFADTFESFDKVVNSCFWG